jgi:hypothetical protein
MQICSTEYVFHTILNPELALVQSLLEKGLRPLSDFPDSERWQQIQAYQPDFFEALYGMIAEPVIGLPYSNSGIFVSPIDFRLLPDSIMYDKTRIRIPLDRIDPATAALTYVLDDQRVSLPLTEDNLIRTAEIWTEELVRTWFARDQSKIFFYVPQIAVYQAGGIPIHSEDIEKFT